MGNERLFSVCETMSICNVTRRELFNYEEKGLIKPRRNKENNYRNYTETELFRICFIKECRRVSFDYDSIQTILKDNSMSTLRRVLDKAANAARKELDANYHNYIKRIEKYNSMREATYIIDTELRDNHIETIETQDHYIVRHEYQRGFFDDILEFQKEYSKLDKIIDKYQFTKISPMITCFEDHFDTQTGEVNHEPHLVRSYYRVAETNSDCPAFAKERGFKAIMTKHTGDYGEGLAAEYQRLIQYANENGMRVKGYSVEELILDESFSYINKKNWATKVYMPIY